MGALGCGVGEGMLDKTLDDKTDSSVMVEAVLPLYNETLSSTFHGARLSRSKVFQSRFIQTGHGAILGIATLTRSQALLS
jgi:hypothetical protein